MWISPKWLTLFALGALPLLLAGLSPLFPLLTALWACLLTALLIKDWLGLPAAAAITVQREAPDRLIPGESQSVRVRVENHSGRPLRLLLHEAPPIEFSTDKPETPYRFTLAPSTRQSALYHITAPRRGDYEFGDLFLKIEGGLGLGGRITTVPAKQRLKVYPSLQEAGRLRLLARKGRMGDMGTRRARQQGAGSEFESLRDYLPDDELRKVDWKASARRGVLTTRQYELERSRNIVIMADAGRTMLADLEGKKKIDHAVQAVVTLAAVALESDDRVGLLVFSDHVHCFLPPARGRGQIQAIMEMLYNLEAAPVEADYRMALGYLQARFRKRSLLVCFTDIWEAASSRRTLLELASARARHLPVAVTLLDTGLLQAARIMPETPEEAFRKAAAVQAVEERERALALLRERGVLVVDSPADRLSADLVARYIEVKERQVL